MKVEQIQAKFEEVHARMRKETEHFPWHDREAYTSWLAQTLEYVTYGPRVLALTAGHFPLEQTALATRFIQHAAEERGHDKLLHNDAKALGVSLKSLSVLSEAEAFHKSVYFWIYHARPAVIMGWILFLEGLAIRSGPTAFEKVAKAHGAKAGTFLRVHTQEDPDHIEKAMEILKCFSAEELNDVAHGLELYADLYENVLSAIVRKCGAQARKAG